ncbi:HDOD domain-containing protein [Thermodesulfobacteriota bacterium]
MIQQAKTYEIIRDDRITNLIELVNASEISSIKNIVSNLIKIINDPKSTGKDLKGIIEIDPPLTARLLRLANSAYYSPPNKFGEIMKAIIWIGYDAIKALALSQKVCEIFTKNESFHGYSRIDLWKHSLAVALLGKLIYRREFGERGENVYAAGLLHDIGIIIEDQFYQNEFKEVLNKAQIEKTNLRKSESNFFGYDHADIGKALTANWKLPEEICISLGNHHNPEKVEQEFSKITCTLYIADSFCHERDIGYNDEPFKGKVLLKECMKKIGIGSHAVHLIMGDVEQEISNMEDEGFF